MKIEAQINPGICNFNTTVTATTEDSQNTTFKFITECEIIKIFEKQLEEISPIDAIETLGPEENIILAKANKLLQTQGCCDACVVPAGAVKAMQIAAGLALPKDVSITITEKE